MPGARRQGISTAFATRPTAFAYTDGASERMLGKLAAPIRDRLFLSTKAANDRPATRENLQVAFDQSRSRLGVDEVDLYYLHRFDDETPLEETFDTLAGMQSDGLIRYIGVSNFAAWQMMKAQAVCAGLGTRIDAIQPMYNLVKRQAEVEILPACEDQDIAVCPYSPLGGGLLTGKYSRGLTGRLTDNKMYASRYGQAWMHETAQAFADLAEEVGTDCATLTVSWVAHHPAVTSTLISARSVEQLQPSLDAPLHARISATGQAPAPATDRSEQL